MELKGSKESGEEEEEGGEAPTEGDRKGMRQIGNERKTEGEGVEVEHFLNKNWEPTGYPPSLSHLLFSLPLSFSGIIKPQCGNISWLAAYRKAVCPR